jgi:hypothetical protein
MGLARAKVEAKAADGENRRREWRPAASDPR